MKKINSLQMKAIVSIIIIAIISFSFQVFLLKFLSPISVVLVNTLIVVGAGLLILKILVIAKINNLNNLIFEFKADLKTGKRIEAKGEREFLEIINEINEILDETEKSSKNLEIFKIAIENSSDQVVITDQDGTVQYANPTTERLTGFKKEEIIGNNPRLWGRQMPPEVYKEMWDTIKIQKKVYEAEFINKKKDGTHYYVKGRIEPVLDNNGELKLFIAVERDITLEKNHEESVKKIETSNEFLEKSRSALTNILEDTKELEEKLKQEKQGIEKKIYERTKQLSEEKIKMSASINSLTLGFIMTDNQNNITLINQAARKLLCSSKESPLLMADECTLNHIEDELKDAIDLRLLINQTIVSRSPKLVKELEFENRFLKILITPIAELANVLGTVVLIEDVTEAKILERSKDEFFSIASHELRTPLTAIRGNTSLIKDYFSEEIKSEELKSMLSDINESSIRLIQIVNDFLDMSRLELGKIEFKKEKVGLVELIESVIKEYDSTGTLNNLYLHFSPSAVSLPDALADKNRTRQILVNLIGNALKYTEKGGITISVENKENYLKVLISDTGKGIPFENQKLLFRKFQQAGSSIFTRDFSRSTGLGLYISRLMAEGMNGEVHLDKSEIGIGSTFSLSLPVNTESITTNDQFLNRQANNIQVNNA